MENNNFNMKNNDLKDLGFFDFEPKGRNQHTSIPFGFKENGIVALDLDEWKNGGMLTLAEDVGEIEALQEAILLMGCMKYSPDDLRVMAISKNSSLASNLKKWDLPQTISTICVGNYYDFAMALENLLNFIKRRDQKLQILGKINNVQVENIFEFNKIALEDSKNSIMPMERVMVFIDDIYDIIDTASRESEKDGIMERLAQVIISGKDVGVYLVAGATPRAQLDYKITKSVAPYVSTLGTFRLENGLEAELSLGGDLEGHAEDIEGLAKGQLFLVASCENGKKKSLVKLAKYDTLQREEYVSAIKDNYFFFQNN